MGFFDRKPFAAQIFRPDKEFGVFTEIVPLGNEADIFLGFDEAKHFTGVWLGLKRQKGSPEVIRLERVVSALYEKYEDGAPLGFLLADGAYVHSNELEREGLGGPEVQSFLRMLCSFARRPSDYGKTASDLREARSSVEVDEGERFAFIAVLAALLPVGEAMGRTKRLLKLEEKTKAIRLLSCELGKLLALECLADRSEKKTSLSGYELKQSPSWRNGLNGHR